MLASVLWPGVSGEACRGVRKGTAVQSLHLSLLPGEHLTTPRGF